VVTFYYYNRIRGLRPGHPQSHPFFFSHYMFNSEAVFLSIQPVWSNYWHEAARRVHAEHTHATPSARVRTRDVGGMRVPHIHVRTRKARPVVWNHGGKARGHYRSSSLGPFRCETRTKGPITAMLARDIEQEAGILLSSTITRPRRPPVVVWDALIVGFDTEYRPSDRALLSVQLAARRSDGSLESRVYYPPHPKMSLDYFSSILGQFIKELHLVLPRKRRVYLVAHFSQAELGGFENPLRDWNILEMNKAHQASTEVIGPDGKPMSLCLKDLFGYFPTSLARIGESVGYNKLEIDPTKLEELLRDDRPAFEAYAKRDAEIVLVALERFRQKMLSDWGIDVLQLGTIAAVASEIFRRGFLRHYPAPVKLESGVERRRGSKGYRQAVRTVLKFNGSSDVRLMACRAYWGGRTEAFGRGLYVGPVVMWDVISLYPHAALLQPLPNDKTEWKSLARLEDVVQAEGFGQFEFEFPAGTMYPCLPVVREGVKRLTFPLKGETHCTFAEVRAALSLGAVVTPVRTWGFSRTTRERESMTSVATCRRSSRRRTRRRKVRSSTRPPSTCSMASSASSTSGFAVVASSHSSEMLAGPGCPASWASSRRPRRRALPFNMT
jgi:hypothetical protein